MSTPRTHPLWHCVRHCFIRRNVVRLIAVVALIPSAALACLWDHDTLRQERSKFPEVLELITGKFLRHSPEFYEWRIKDRTEKLKTDPTNLAYHDDLAVAYSKVGRTKDAIAMMEAKEKLKPGLYETYSNLGTFYILAGEFEKGLPYIDKALAINPDAHFGREKYQKWVVEYALTRKANDGSLKFPLYDWDQPKSVTFLQFINKKIEAKTGRPGNADDAKAAITGVLGMMRFANYDNPLLLEALAHVLRYQQGDGSADRLAARALLQASYRMTDATAREKYRQLAQEALSLQKGVRDLSQPSPNTEDDFKAELADAGRWYDDLRAKEIAWIQNGSDVEAEFDRLYTEAPRVADVEKSDPRTFANRIRRISWPRTLGLALGIVGLVGTIFVAARRRSAQHTATSGGV